MDSDVQDVGNPDEAGQAIQDCLRNPVILRKIFHHISNRQLLKLSVMNKLWNYEARSVMRKRGNLMAYLRGTSRPPFQPDLAAFETDLRRMSVVPFSGISIKIDYCRNDHHPVEAVDSTIDAILDQLSLKSVSIDVGGMCWANGRTSSSRRKSADCPTILLARKLLRHFSGTLEELSLNIRCYRPEFVQQVFHGFTFSRLKILKLEEQRWLGRSAYKAYIEALVSRSPNLEELHVEVEPNLKENVMKGSSAVLIYKPLDCTARGWISENALRALKVEGTPLIHAGQFFNLDIERFNRVYPALLQAFGSTTLTKMRVDAVLAVRLMCYRIRLENVRELNMFIKFELVQPRLLAILKNFDFTRILPSLDKVTVTGNISHYNLSPPVDQVNTLIEEANAILGMPLPDRAANIKELLLHGALSDNAAAFYAQMFPNAEKLDISLTEEREIPLASICKYWVHLKELEVTAEGDLVSNLDSVICGIFPEEVAELRQMDDEFLKRVNIVPIAPSITSLTNLRCFTFKLGYNYKNDHLPLLPSKVTGLLAFAKCPKLAVTLKCNWLLACQMMSELKPYASVVHEAYRMPDGVALTARGAWTEYQSVTVN